MSRIKFDDNKVLIIAEIGNNHEGSFDVAQEMVRKAAECGVDAVKFQTFITEHYVSQVDRVRFERLKKFELNPEEFFKLAELARSLGLLFISTPFDLTSASRLEKLVDCYKIASSDNTFYPLLDKIAGTGKPIIVSTGLCDLNQAKKCVSHIREVWRQEQFVSDLAVLHCVSSYPVPLEEINLNVIAELKSALNCLIGYSDHTLGIDAAVLSVAAGAKIVEKHFTLDKNFSDFRDHQLSADPEEMAELVKRIRTAEIMLGSGVKEIQPCEEENVTALRRSIVAAKDIKKGSKLEFGDLTWIRPGGGLPPGREQLLTGKHLIKDKFFGESITEADVE